MRAWALILLASQTLLRAQTQPSIRGFTVHDTPAEWKLEQEARSLPESAHLRQYMDFMAALPHNAGSPRSKVVAEYILRNLNFWGVNAQIEEFEALLPLPTLRGMEVISPKYYIARLREPYLPQDPSSGQAHQLPTFNAYSASGDVTGEVIYVNYGVPADYEWLAKQNIDVKGRIVIARYGQTWRGTKAKVAAEHGALACIIYSDPQQDGYFEGDPFPVGPMRPAEGVQRGSVLDMPLYPGDPLSPGWASEKGARKLPIAEAKSIMKIPVLPISYADAQPILEPLTGPVTPRNWRGGLPFTYHTGPGVKVHLRLDFDWSSRPLYNVIATIPGSESPDEWVLAGNHHDAWVNGADDPVSGAVALLETARTLGTLQKQGWRPKRTIKIAFWDGEEFGLMGSTEWVEKHQDELRQKAVAYLNSDNTGKGWLSVEGSHTLEQFVSDVAASIPQPNSASTNLADGALHHPPTEDDDDLAMSKPRKNFTIGALGASSDYVAFLDYLGVASTNEGFAGQSKSGIYHSIYDSIYWYRNFSDGGFLDGRALSQFTAAALLRLSGAAILPFEFGRFEATVSGYVDDIERLAQLNSQKLDLAAIRRQLDILKVSSDKYEAVLDAVMLRGGIGAARAISANQELIKTERALTQPEGLPNRAWYKHQIYAPGVYTGYSAKTIPGVREALEAKDLPLAQREASIVEQCLLRFNDTIDAALTAIAGL